MGMGMFHEFFFFLFWAITVFKSCLVFSLLCLLEFRKTFSLK
jgi:hypothetical protein